MERDHRGDREFRVSVSNLAWSSNGWKESAYLLLKRPDLYETVCGSYKNIRNARKVIRVPVIEVAKFYYYLFREGVEQGHHAAMPVINYEPRKRVPLAVRRQRQRHFAPYMAARDRKNGTCA